MKNFLFLAFLAILIAGGSCLQSEKKNAAISQTSDKSENIDFNHAVELIYNFMKDTTLRKIGQSFAIGGTFPKDYFFTPSGNLIEGINLWFCYNKNADIHHPVFFASIERRPDLNTYPRDPLLHELIRPVNNFTYNGAIDQDAVRKYLLNTSGQNDDTVRPIMKTKVVEYAKNFNDLISTYLDSRGERYCEQPFSFFQNESIEFQGREIPALDGLVDKNAPMYVRYYFGYDSSVGENRIRLILFPVDSLGKNIVADFKSDGVILQKSVPPR